MRRVLLTIGTRPEAIKLAPVFFALREMGVEPIVLATGQHTTLLDGALNTFGIEPDIMWRTMEPKQTPQGLTAKLLPKMSQLLDEVNPDYVVVQGDTTTAFVGALASHYAQLPIGHVEAGVRSGNLSEPWPEEMHRRAISDVATHHFAPTDSERKSLLAEGVESDRVFVTGNTVIDAMHLVGGWQDVTVTDQALVTVHRRENDRDNFERVVNLLRSQIEAHEHFEFRVILHPNPNAHEALKNGLAGFANVSFLDPLPYDQLLRTMAASRFVLTDSGGLQEEATEMGVGVIVLRDHPDRFVGAERGVWFSGRDTARCAQAVDELLSRSWEPVVAPYGHGTASTQIAKIISEYA